MTLTLAIIACFVDAELTTFSILTPSKYDSSSIRPSSRAIFTLFSIFFTSLNRFFFEFETLARFGGVDEGMDDEDATGEPGSNGVDTVAIGDGWGAKASCRVFISSRSRLCVARTEHFRQMQSVSISSRVYSSRQASSLHDV